MACHLFILNWVFPNECGVLSLFLIGTLQEHGHRTQNKH